MDHFYLLNIYTNITVFLFLSVYNIQGSRRSDCEGKIEVEKSYDTFLLNFQQG
jgi:hypothetical protein